MPDFRCYCHALPEAAGAQVQLSPEESNHLVAANRARTGDRVRLFDGTGLEAEARLTRADKRKAELTIESVERLPAPSIEIALAQALPKGKLFESIVKKATELGAQTLFPINSSRVESKIDRKNAAPKAAKWQTASLEAAKQSGNPIPARVHELLGFEEFLQAAAAYELKLVASLDPCALSLKRHLAQRDKQPCRSVVWLVGPEGDFSPEEYQQAYAAGFLPTNLGPHVMRSDTAAIHALSITCYELGEA